jgi:hypothetical protein
MASAREMRLRIKSVKNISQVTRALETVSASKVRKAINAVTATRADCCRSRVRRARTTRIRGGEFALRHAGLQWELLTFASA